MLTHAQTIVDQKTVRFSKHSGHDQHADISTTITTSIATSSVSYYGGSGRGPGCVGRRVCKGRFPSTFCGSGRRTRAARQAEQPGRPGWPGRPSISESLPLVSLICDIKVAPACSGSGMSWGHPPTNSSSCRLSAPAFRNRKKLGPPLVEFSLSSTKVAPVWVELQTTFSTND